MACPIVCAVPVPEDGLAAASLKSVDYADAYATFVPAGTSARRLARAMFESPPAWVYALLGLRDALVAPLEFITTRSAPRRAESGENDTGDSIGVLPVLAEAAHEILLGLDDRHLGLRISVRIFDDARGRLGAVTTLVRFHNILGRAYFLPVRSAHRVILPAMLRHGVRMQRASPARTERRRPSTSRLKP